MRGLRYLLIAASLGTAAFLSYIVATEKIYAPWIIAGFIASCLLNAAYLLWARPSGEPRKSRIFGLFSLWLDAKESELRGRAKRSQ